jgi:gliding motility-associated-like protein
VTVTDGLCVAKDSIIYTVNPAPTFTSVPTNTNACLANNGEIDVIITGPVGPPDYLFTYFITGPTSVPSGNNQTVGPLPTFTGLAAGAYGITVADQVSGCASIDTEVINDPAFTATVVKVNACDPLILRVTPSAGAIYPINYRVIDATTAQAVATGTAPSGPTFDTPGVPSGTYIVELTAAGGCVFSTPATPFAQDPPLVVSFNTTDICNGNITAVAAGATSFDWSQSPAGSLVNPAATTATVAVNPGSWLLTVTANGGAVGTCPGTATTNVTIDNFTPAFTQSDACQNQVTLTATPSGSFTYRWFRNNVFIPGGRQITVAAADDNASYFVRVVSTLNGCIKPSPAANVQVDGELNVTLATTTPCEGSPFTLTATPNRSATFQWALDSSPISGETSATLEDDRSGTYTVTATAATCTATADIEIDLAPSTPGLLRDQAYICPDPANPDPETRQVVLDPGDFVSYDWQKDGVSLGDFKPTLTADQPGLYSVNLVNTFGCPSSDKTDVIEECDPVIVGPNAFRPTSTVQGQGGDLVNQSFKLFTFFIDDDEFQVFIFNRWGEMIFQSPERDFKWNGGYNNNLSQIAPAGTYSYVVRYKSKYRPEEGIQEKRGGVVLLR